MNAQSKVEVPENVNLKLWNAVSKTDPRHTKKVNQRGGFTAISAHYQVMSATAEFGPVGIGWGYLNGEPIWHDNLVVVPVTLWHGDRSNTFGPIYGAAEWKNGARLDSDAAKKASTDGLTKGLSQLGFNADVFLGRFDDNKYVAELAKEFAANDAVVDEQPPKKREPLNGPYKSKTALWTAVKEFDRTLRGIGDLAEFLAYLETAEVAELIEQCKRDAPGLWSEGLPDLPEYVPLEVLIAQQKRDLEQIDEIANSSGARNLRAG